MGILNVNFLCRYRQELDIVLQSLTSAQKQGNLRRGNAENSGWVVLKSTTGAMGWNSVQTSTASESMDNIACSLEWNGWEQFTITCESLKEQRFSKAPHLEKAFYDWICDRNSTGFQVSGAVVCKMAQRLQAEKTKHYLCLNRFT